MEKARRPARPKKRPVQYRHELKYYINRGDYEILSRRLRSCIQQDENAQRNGGEYFIRSLYFDSPFDDALWEKLSGVDESLYEAAKVDGAGPVRIFFSITLPEIKLPLFYTTIMTTTGAFNVWGQPVMLTNGGPNYQTQVLLMDIRNLAFPAGPAAAGMASAMALLLGIILMAIAAIQLIFMNKED